ncbi:MAG: hypothetical protein B0D91_13135 [Oceanospirillales bacterium LUC14_002_19_P2]|nr:MAG: hypothetical protein B0D91_13135 [Oceanospirillales bacterium LUC14_002_19_P2]
MERDDLQQTFVVIDDPAPAEITVADNASQEEALAPVNAQASMADEVPAPEPATVEDTVDIAEQVAMDDEASEIAQASIDEPEPAVDVEPTPPEPEWVKNIPAEPVDTPAMAPPSEPSNIPSLVESSTVAASEMMSAPAADSPQSSSDCQPAYSTDQFYLQFSASQNVDGLKALAARLQPVETEIIPTMVKGETWMVLISKGFSSREAAGSLAALLEQQGVSKPWVRPGYSLLPVLADQTLMLPGEGCP